MRMIPPAAVPVPPAIPKPSVAKPSGETVGGNAGTDPARFAQEGHQHERLTSVTGRKTVADTSHTIGSTGESPAIMFTRSFASEPGIDIMAIEPNAADVLLPPFVARWIMGTAGTPDAGKYLGVVIGWKKLILNTNTVVVLNITVLGGSTIQQVAANGTRFTCIAIARSDMAN